MIRHFTIVVPNTATGLSLVVGSVAAQSIVGPTAVAARAPLPVAGQGGFWGAPYISSNTPALAAFGCWASRDTSGAVAAALAAIAAITGCFTFTWDDANETLDAYSARWRAACGWTEPTAATVQPTLAPVSSSAVSLSAKA